MTPSKAIEKYLQNYAEPESTIAGQLAYRDSLTCRTFNAALGLPCYAEPVENLERLLAFLSRQADAIVILVLNQPDNLDTYQAESANSSNAQWIERLNACCQPIDIDKSGDSPFYHYRIGNNDILLVDRYSINPLPNKQGVGLARKIIGDIALSLLTKNILQSPWLHCIDADSILPKDFLIRARHINISAKEMPAAFINQFQHVDQSGNPVSLEHHNPIVQATALYEMRLHQYVEGLREANSAYSYHSIGSCLSLSLNHYALARGFPRQSAGEDFYLLNKLRKLGDIKTMDGPPIQLIARDSTRTPYGTGATVSKILLQDSKLDAAIFYPPVLFKSLNVFIAWLHTLADCVINEPTLDWRKNLEHHYKDTSIMHDYNASSPFINEATVSANITANVAAMISATASIDFDRGLKHCIAHAKTPGAFNTQMFYWFDGFKTLKWLHQLRDNQKLTMLTLEQLRHTKSASSKLSANKKSTA